jgi:peptidoglycan/xylan/chitin deacetylase (PgdA/CDA1 family)
MLSVCFDDFPRTAWTEGGRVLRDHAVRGTYYVSGGLAGTVFGGQRMYDAADLETIHAEGHELACHTFDHRSCLRRREIELSRSLDDNERFVRERVGDVRLVSFAYPYGDVTVSAKCLAVGRFSSSRGVDAGLNRGRLDLGQLKAVGLEASKRRIAEVEPFVGLAAEQGAWLVVYTHDVQSSPSDYGCRPEELDRLLSTARTAGLVILPVKAALAARAFAHPGLGPSDGNFRCEGIRAGSPR